MSDSKPHQSQYRGWLYKWTNYLKGYQKRWFVLQNGLLSYYRNQAEMAHTCRGTINLANAFIHTEDSCTFVISNGGAQSFYLKATSEVERQKWVTALELAKAEAIRMLEAESDEEEAHQPDKFELQNTLRTLNAKLEDLNTCNDLIAKHGAALQKTLSELEQMDSMTDVASRLKAVNERATLFRITSNAMINACSEYYEFAQVHGKRWQRVLQFEHDQRLKLEEMVEQLAKDQVSLENKARKSLQNVKKENPGSNPSDDEDFFDALDHQVEEFEVALPHNAKKSHRRTDSDFSMESYNNEMSSESESETGSPGAIVITSKTDSPQKKDAVSVVKGEHRRPASHDKSRTPTSSVSYDSQNPSSASDSSAEVVPKRVRRRRIQDKPNFSLNLWSIMKNCIGRELSKIPMPVNFNEPLSMLQRLTEEFEYTHCLDMAAQCEDSAEQLAWVAAFTISAYATTLSRTGKPFNPLLGETYESDRMDDLGWRSIAEQVSHHPPTLAVYGEGKEWKLWQEFTMTSKFRGKYLQIIPMGIAHLVFPKSGNHYTWRKVTTTVHNIIVGKLWVDSHGEMDITNHRNGDKCHLKYSAYSYFSRDIPRKVSGVVTDASGKPKWVMTGTWDSQMEGAKVVHVEESNKGKPVFETGPHKVMWKVNKPMVSCERIYHFTQLAVELNEPEEGVAPTDSRNRPDQRHMENGKWDEANRVKIQLEEKQRAARKKRDSEAEKAKTDGNEYKMYEPKWFRKEVDSTTGSLIHTYTDEYWQCKKEQNWDRCPDIFL